MKVGMIVEGLPDSQVLTYFAKRIRPGIEVQSRAIGNKSLLIADCGIAARDLLNSGCGIVLIVWDLHPDSRRREKRTKLNSASIHTCENDYQLVRQTVEDSGADVSKVQLVCIDAMLETWLLVDHRGIRDFLLSRGALREPVKSIGKLKQNRNPKNLMKRLFKQKSRLNLQYNDVEHAIHIARSIPVEDDDLKRLRKLDSFSRFASAITRQSAIH